MTTDRQPRDAMVVRQVLKSMGVQEYDPRVVHHLLDFMHNYISRVLQDADAYAERAGRQAGEVVTEDVVLAIQAQAEHSFAAAPPQEVVLEMAERRNAQKLPELSAANRHGLRVPPEDMMVVAPNVQLRSAAAASAARAGSQGPGG